jgi:hypothetical protein
MTRRQYGQLDTRSIEERAWANEQSVRLLAHHSSEGSVQYFSHIRFGLSGLRYWLKR